MVLLNSINTHIAKKNRKNKEHKDHNPYEITRQQNASVQDINQQKNVH